MFTGLVQAVGKIVSSTPLSGGARELEVDVSGLEALPQIGASIAINGVCQTVTSVTAGAVATFCAVEETIRRSNLGRLNKGSMVNLEAALKVGDSLDGHFVLGHVDAVGSITDIRPEGSSQVWYFTLPGGIKAMFAEKGSITIDGISLTISAVYEDTFTVSIIPHTASETRLKYLGIGDEVNLEVDVLARYIARLVSCGGVTTEANTSGGIDMDFLANNGFV